MSNFEKVSAEVYAVLKEIPKSQINKIPPKVIKMFEENKNYSNEIKIDINKKIEEQNISKEAKDIIFLIGLNYWLTEEERKEVLIKLKENESALKEKYNIENIFKNTSNNKENSVSNVLIIEKKEKWYLKIIKKILKLFKRKQCKKNVIQE